MCELRPESVHDETEVTGLAFRAVAVSVAEFRRPRERQDVKIKDARLPTAFLLTMMVAACQR